MSNFREIVSRGVQVFMKTRQQRRAELAAEGVQEVAGYEFPLELDFCREAEWILENVQRRGCAYFQIDDGPHPEVQQLKLAAQEGYFIFLQIDDHRFVVFEPDVYEINVEASDVAA